MRLQLATGSEADLPPKAIRADGGRVDAITPVAGSSGQQYDVAISANPGIRSVIISTVPGVALASGLALTQSNTITVQVDTSGPQVCSCGC